MKDTGFFSRGWHSVVKLRVLWQFGCISDTHTHHLQVNPSPLQLRGSAVLRFRHANMSSWAAFEPAFNEDIKSSQTATMSAWQIESMFCWGCFLVVWSLKIRWFELCRIDLKKSICKNQMKTKDWREKRHEAQTRRLRGEPRTRCATCRCKARLGTWRACSRSLWRTRCSEPCGGTRSTEVSQRCKRCTRSAGSSQNSAPHCGATPPSMPRCAPRQRCVQSWRTATGTRRNSVCGCSRRASSGGDGCSRGGPRRSVVMFSIEKRPNFTDPFHLFSLSAIWFQHVFILQASLEGHSLRRSWRSLQTAKPFCQV